MNNRALLSALALCFAAGCEQKPAEPPKPKTAAAVVPVPPEAPKAPAASAGQDAKPVTLAATAQQQGIPGCSGARCLIKVSVTDENSTPCKFSFKPDELNVYGPQTIRWVVDGGWLFTNDGIVLPSGNQQFTNQQGANSATYSWDDRNTDKNKYKYQIAVKKGNKTCKGDPSVVNGADYDDPNYPPP